MKGGSPDQGERGQGKRESKGKREEREREKETERGSRVPDTAQENTSPKSTDREDKED